MFSVRNQIGLFASVVAALVIAALPVTITFAQGYNYSYAPYMQNYNQVNYRSPGAMTYATGGYNQQYQQQYQYYQPQQNYQLYWCNGYYSYSPCPVPQHYYYPQQHYYYPASYSYWYDYSYSYGYGWDSWGGWYW